MKLGIKPTSTRPDGSPRYTLPAIYDPSTAVYISDSFCIAEYLERTYPETPSIFPHNTIAFQSLYEGNIEACLLQSIIPFILPDAGDKLNPASQDYYRRSRSEDIGRPLDEIKPKGEAAVALWGKFKEGLGKVDAWYAKNDGPFLMGDMLSWADFVTGSSLIFLRTVWGTDSKQWKDISSWHGGRWETLLGSSLRQYQTVT